MIIQIKAITLTKKVARQLRVHHTLTQVEFNLLKSGFKPIGLVDLDNEYYVLVESKTRLEDVRLLHVYSLNKDTFLSLFGIADPITSLHRVILT